jgi:hypothetical protein
MKAIEIPTPDQYSVLEGELTLTESDVRHLGAFADSTRQFAKKHPKDVIPYASGIFGQSFKQGSALLKAMKASEVYPVFHSGDDEGHWYIEPKVDDQPLADGFWLDAFNLRTGRMLCKGGVLDDKGDAEYVSTFAFTAGFREAGTQPLEVVRSEVITNPDVLRRVLHAEFVAATAR